MGRKPPGPLLGKNFDPTGPTTTVVVAVGELSVLTVGTRPTSSPRERASFLHRRSWGTERMMGTWRGAWVVPLEMVECRREQVERAGRARDIGGDMVNGAMPRCYS